MNVSIDRPQILQIKIEADPGDSISGKCQWMIINFDLKNWSMNASGDNGNYQYSWAVENSGRSFLELMCELDKEYLLCKVADKTVFSVKDTINNIKYNYDLTKKQEEFLDNFERKYSVDREGFNMVLSDSGLFDRQFVSDIWECMEYDYSTNAKIFAEIFTTIIRDEIKKYIKINESKIS